MDYVSLKDVGGDSGAVTAARPEGRSSIILMLIALGIRSMFNGSQMDHVLV